jgi:hypothetical protein
MGQNGSLDPLYILCHGRLKSQSYVRFVMAGLDPAIHVFLRAESKTWMPGTRPGMTSEVSREEFAWRR